MKNQMRFLTFFLFLAISISSAQYDASPKQIDSMLSALHELPIDSSRTPLLVNLWRAHINKDIDKAFKFSNELIALGKKLNNVAIQHTGYQRMGIAYSYIDDYPSSNIYYRKAMDLSKKNERHSSTAAMQINIAINHAIMNQHDSTLIYAEKSIKNFAKENDSTGIGACYGVIANMHFTKGEYRLSLESSMKAMGIAERHNDRRSMKDAMQIISKNYLKMRDTTNAVRYFTRLMSLNKEDSDNHGLISDLNNLGAIYVNNRDSLGQAKTYLDEAWELSNTMKFPSGQLGTLHNMGQYYKKRGDFKQAKQSLKKAIVLADSLNQIANVVASQLILAEIATKEKDYQQSETMALTALSMAKQKGLLEDQAMANRLLSDNSLQQNNTGQSLSYFKRFKILNDSIYNIENGQRLSELQTIYETEKKETEIALQEKEITTLNQEIEISNLKKGLYAGGMVSALALSGLLVFGFRQRMKRNKIESEKQEEIYKQEIAHKKKELASQTLHLVQKNTFLEELKENLENLRNSPDKFKMEFRRIAMLLKKEKASDRDWETFKTYFSEVHNDFDQKLKTLYADISEKEIRLAAFLRMNLTTKEIAATLNVLPDSILKSKYRLKKKLGLDKETDLNQFLNEL